MATPKEKWKKWTIISIVLLIIIALAYWFLKPKPQKPNYITAAVTRGDIENSVMASGKIEAKNQVDVGAQVSGEVINLYVDVGDDVTKGQEIAQIDPVTQQNALTTQKATLEQSIANFESSKANYASKQANLEIAKSDLISKETVLKTAQSDLVAKQANLKTAQSDLVAKQATYQQAITEQKRLQLLLKSHAVSKQELEKAETAVKTAQAGVESAKNAIASAQANIENAKNNIATAKVNIENAKNAITSAQANVLVGQSDIITAQANIKKAQTDVNTAEQRLGYTRIVAPISGTVISITTKQGQTVNSNQSAPTIVTLADLKTVRVKAKISEADVINLTVGMPVYFNVIGNVDKKYSATLQAIEPAPEGTKASSTSNTNSAVYYVGYFDVPNPDGKLRIDMTAQVYIIQDKVENVLNVPAAAIKKDPKQGDYLLVLQDDGSTKKQPVKTGLTNRVNTQILSGATEGQKVVMSEAHSEGNNKKPPRMM